MNRRKVWWRSNRCENACRSRPVSAELALVHDTSTPAWVTITGQAIYAQPIKVPSRMELAVAVALPPPQWVSRRWSRPHACATAVL